jgi:hypothetical protein
MKRQILLMFVLAFLFFSMAFVTAISVEPIYISKDYVLNDPQPTNIILVFTGDANRTTNVTLTEEGSIASFISESPISFQLVNANSQQVTVSFNIPPQTTPNMYEGKIRFSANANDFVPVFINVKQSAGSTNCKISTSYPEYYYTIKKGTQPQTEEFNFKVSSQCYPSIDITDVRVIGSILTENGFQPIALTGGSVKGTTQNAGDTFNVPIKIDISDLDIGNYVVQLMVTGDYNDTLITSTIKYIVTVTGTSSQYQNNSQITPPIFDSLPSTMNINQSYVITARGLSPGMTIKVEPNQYIYGEYVEYGNDATWRYHLHPTQLGVTNLVIYAEYYGSQIGSPINQTVNILPVGAVNSSTYLKFRFFPELNEAQDNSTVRILLADNVTGNIVDGIVYLNGALLEKVNGSYQFILRNGQQYTLNGLSTGYHSIEQIININPQSIIITISPANPKKGDTISITTNPSNASITIEGKSVQNGTYLLESEGTILIIASNPGYQTTEYNLTVTPKLGLILYPNVKDSDKDTIGELKSGESYTFGLDEPPQDSFQIVHIDTDTNEQTIIANTTDKTITFTPTEQGTYSVEADGIVLGTYEIEPFNLLEKWWFWTIIGILVVVVIAFFVIRRRNSEVGGFPLIPSGGEPEVQENQFYE